MQRRAFLHTGLAAGLWGVGAAGMAPGLLAEPRRTDPAGPLRLSSNENPLGISPAARRAIIDGLGEANRYPRGKETLIEALAAKHGVPPESVVLGEGSTEILRMAVHALAGPDGRLVTADPTFEDFCHYGAAFDLPTEAVPLLPDHSHDLERMAALAEAGGGPVVVFICNPNNPTGTLTASAAVDAWIARAPEHVYFLVDEAYFDFVTDPAYHSAIHWIAERPNVVVSRTFSKVYGMAGIRLGYALAHPATARRFTGVATRNNANHFALVAGLASLGDDAFVRRSLEANARGKAILYGCLEELDLPYIASHTNFVMHRIAGDLETYNAWMLAQGGVRVGRPFPPMLSHSRLSIGLPDEMERFADVLRRCRREGVV